MVTHLAPKNLFTFLSGSAAGQAVDGLNAKGNSDEWLWRMSPLPHKEQTLAYDVDNLVAKELVPLIPYQLRKPGQVYVQNG